MPAMPSFHHEALLQLFRNRPRLAPELLRDALHLRLPEFIEARIESADLTDIQPAEYRADLVVLLLDERPLLGIIIEAQPVSTPTGPHCMLTWFFTPSARLPAGHCMP
jgi:hypothetical protein